MLPAETRYHAGEQELLAVIKALEHWRCYLEGAEFTVITDHQPNVTLNDRAPEKLSRRQVRWQQFLSRFDFQWQWKQGKANVADPLSRNPALLNSIQSYSLHSPADDFLAKVSNGYDKDPYFKDNRQTRKLQFDGSFWRRKSAIVIPKVGSLRNQCIALHHDAPYAGHLGRDRTLHSISRHYWWSSIYSDVSDYVEHCDSCQRNKAPTQRVQGLLKPLQVPSGKWDSVSMDLITQLPETARGHSAIIVFQDRLSKMVHIVPSSTSVGAKEFANAFVREVFAKHGLPSDFISDRDPRFTSEFFSDLCKQLGIKQNLSTAFHPQTDGQTERSNRVIEDILRAYVNPAQDDWDIHLPLVEFAINNAYQASIRTTPFFLNYGFHPRCPTHPNPNDQAKTTPVKFAAELQANLDHAKSCIRLSQHHMETYANKKRRHAEFQAGDWVLLSSKHLRLKFDGVKKLMNRYFGPFEVEKKVGNLAYELKLPASMQIHDVFHVSLLKLYKRRGDENIQIPPPALLPDGGTEYEVDAIHEHQILADGSFQFRVHWKGHEGLSWLDQAELSNCKDLIKAYCKEHNLQLPQSKRASKRASEPSMQRRSKRQRRS